MKALILLLPFMLTSCNPWMSRLEAVEKEIAEMEVAIEKASPEDKEILEPKLEKLKEERRQAEENAKQETQNNKTMWLAVLGIITGGMKLAADMAGKAT